MNEWQEGGHMSNWLTLKRLSEKYGVSESTLRVWKCLGYVTSSVIENVVMLDEESVIHFWEMRKTKGLNEEYLEKLIKEKEWERDILLSKLADELFLLRTSELHQPLFHVIIQELGQLITNDREREIFLAISSGKPISWVAANRGMTYAQAVETYSSILRRLGENPGRIATFRKRVMDLMFGKYDTEDPTNIPLYNLVDTRAHSILYGEAGMETVRELLQYTSRNGWNSLKRLRGMGSMTYHHIINTLSNAHFIVIGEDGSIALSPEIAALVL